MNEQLSPSPGVNCHAQALRLFGLEPRISPPAIQAIERCEAECGALVPATVRAWYALEGAVESLAHSEEACGPATLAEFLEMFAEAVAAQKSRKRSRLVFYGPWRVNTGYEVDLLLDGSDDPPISLDDGRRPPFSQYILELAWWKTNFDGQPSILVWGKTHRDRVAHFGPDDLALLASRGEELPRELDFTEANTEPVRRFRFFGPGWRVEVECQGDPTQTRCLATWTLTADSEEQLLELYAWLQPCHGTPVGLVQAKSASHEEMKNRFLARFPEARLNR